MGPCIVIIFWYISNKMQRYTVYVIWKLLYVFRVVPPPIIRSTNNYIYSIWYLSHRYCYLPLLRQVAVTVWQIPDAVDTVVCAPDDGWRYHPKYVEQFPDKINCVTLHLVGYILEYSYYCYYFNQLTYVFHGLGMLSQYFFCVPGSAVGTATGYRLDGPGIESRWERDFPHLSRPALGPT